MSDIAHAVAPRADWDIFCRVVDNFGDIGVTWRLARRIARDFGLSVRLWVDDWGAFSRLWPDASRVSGHLIAGGVEVRRWTDPFPPVSPADVVVEAFGCELPERFLGAMAAREPKPVWINLEYLSAEPWVAGCHRLRSPHPRLPLVKHFFFPGFVAGTGGVLHEPGLVAARDQFRASGRAAFLRAIDVAAPASGTRVISMFAYENPGLDGLLDVLGSAAPVLLLVPEGRVVASIARHFGCGDAPPGTRFVRGALDVRVVPFLDQDRYDRLLWACDVNFVRGEDSFVRAQWAARPFVWHIYRQDEDAHRVKLDAFVDLHAQGLDAAAAEALRGFWHAWNGWGDPATAWPGFAAALPRLQAHAERWCEGLAGAPDLAATLVQFSQGRV